MKRAHHASTNQHPRSFVHHTAHTGAKPIQPERNGTPFESNTLVGIKPNKSPSFARGAAQTGSFFWMILYCQLHGRTPRTITRRTQFELDTTVSHLYPTSALRISVSYTRGLTATTRHTRVLLNWQSTTVWRVSHFGTIADDRESANAEIIAKRRGRVSAPSPRSRCCWLVGLFGRYRRGLRSPHAMEAKQQTLLAAVKASAGAG